MSRLLNALISALGAIIGVSLVYAAVWFTAYGDDALFHSLAGTAISLILAMWGLSIAVFGSSRHFERWTLAILSSLALIVASIAVQKAVNDSVYLKRGQVTSCVITSVDKRVSKQTDSDGNLETVTSYVHGLDCAAAQPHTMTTDTPAGQSGQQIAVRYDPQARLEPIPAGKEPQPDMWLWVCIIALSLGVLVRIISELLGIDSTALFFGSGRGGLSRVRYSAVLMVAGACAAVAVMGGWGAVGWFKEAMFGWFGTDAEHVRRLGWHWLVDIGFWAFYAAVAGLAVGVVRRLWLRLLHAVPWLDPHKAARHLMGEMEMSYGGSFGGLSFIFDAGWLRSLWSGIRRRR